MTCWSQNYHGVKEVRHADGSTTYTALCTSVQHAELREVGNLPSKAAAALLHDKMRMRLYCRGQPPKLNIPQAYWAEVGEIESRALEQNVWLLLISMLVLMHDKTAEWVSCLMT
jgi:hypothetical protein